MAMETHLSIKIPNGLMKQIDEEVALEEFSSRSEFVKAAIRSYLVQIANTRSINKEYSESRQHEPPMEKTTSSGRT